MEELFNEILTQNKDTLYRICRSYADTSTDTEDIFQEVCVQIWKSLPGFEQRSSVRTWAYRICLNVCMRWKYKLGKEKQRRRRLSENYPPADAAGNEQINALYACIKKLNEADRGIMVLYLEDLSYKEIAGLIGITENHVAVKIKRIRAKLFNCLSYDR